MQPIRVEKDRSKGRPKVLAYGVQIKYLPNGEAVLQIQEVDGKWRRACRPRPQEVIELLYEAFDKAWRQMAKPHFDTPTELEKILNPPVKIETPRPRRPKLGLREPI